MADIEIVTRRSTYLLGRVQDTLSLAKFIDRGMYEDEDDYDLAIEQLADNARYMLDFARDMRKARR